MGDYTFLGEEFEKTVEVERGCFVVNKKQQTTDLKIFAGGDAVNHTADAISAIDVGFRACKAIDEMLLG